MISIVNTLFTEYTGQDIVLNRTDSKRVPQTMLTKALRMRSGKKRNSIVIGAKNLLKRNPVHR